MDAEEHEMSKGWPLGLENMIARLRGMERSQASLAPAPAVEPYSIHVQTISFSSFSSSNLDTESTASFFRDNSVSLGIGFKAGTGRSLYFQNAIGFEGHQKISLRGTGSDISKGHGICIPLLLKMNRRRSKPKHGNIYNGHGEAK